MAKGALENSLVAFETSSGQVSLSPEIIKNYLVNGNGAVTDQEVMLFLNLCRYQKLNPFLKEAYLIKYGTFPATIVVGKEAFTKRAESNPQYGGMEAGVIVLDREGELERRIGSLVLKGEELVGGWSRVHRLDRELPIEVEVSLSEYQQFKDGKPTATWGKMPATMIRKVAMMQGLREAFPLELGGMYDEVEVTVGDEIPVQPIEPKLENPTEILEKLKKKMFAKADEIHLTAEMLKKLAQEETGKASSKDFTIEDVEKCLTRIEVLRLDAEQQRQEADQPADQVEAE